MGRGERGIEPPGSVDSDADAGHADAVREGPGAVEGSSGEVAGHSSGREGQED